ncbi:MAG: acetylxylan esterase [Deltaproteobacteria bacterium]|nr:acetylxylan esterase [Deltaproteobacteria bacterium]
MARAKIPTQMQPWSSFWAALFVTAVCVAGSMSACASPHRPATNRCHVQGDWFTFDVQGLPPRIRFHGLCPTRFPLTAGLWHYSRPNRILAGPVTMHNLSHASGRFVAVIDFLAGRDPRYPAHPHSYQSVVDHNQRGFWYGPMPIGSKRQVRWTFTVPAADSAPVLRGAGHIVAVYDEPALILSPADLIAGQRPFRYEASHWRVNPVVDGRRSWATAAGSRFGRPLAANVQLPEPGAYDVWVKGQNTGRVSVGSTTYPPRRAPVWHRCGRVESRTRKITVTIGARAREMDAVALVPKEHATQWRSWADHGPSGPAAHQVRTFVSRLLDRVRCRTAEMASSLDDWKSKATEARRRLRKALDLPGASTASASPPMWRVRGTVRGKGFVVDKLLIRGISGMDISALLYRPGGLNLTHGRRRSNRRNVPAVLHLLGHYQHGMLRFDARSLDACLAASGIAVLAVDTLGYGSRRQFGLAHKENNHNMGLWNVLAGSSAARIIYGEDVRLLDLLWSLPGIDRKRIGVTGSSGGGTASLYLAALDERISAAAVVSAVSTWKDFGNFGGGDAEQFPAGLITIADFPTLLALVAPRPILVGAGRRDDIFPALQAALSVGRAQRIFAMYGASNHITLFQDAGPHGYPHPRQNAALQFFSKTWSMHPTACTTSLALSVRQLRAKRVPDRPTLLDVARATLREARAQSSLTRAQRIAALRRLLRLDRPVPEASIVDSNESSRTFAHVQVRRAVLAVGSQWRLPALIILPRHPKGGVVIIPDGGSREAVSAFQLASKGIAVLALDLPGLGLAQGLRRVQYGLRHSFKNVERYRSIEDFLPASYLLISGDSLYGLRVRLTLAAAQALRRRLRADGPSDNRADLPRPGPETSTRQAIKAAHRIPIGLLGQGPLCGVYAVTAAALGDHIDAVLVLDGLPSLQADLDRSLFALPGLVAPGMLVLGDVSTLAALVQSPLVWAGGIDSAGHESHKPILENLARALRGQPRSKVLARNASWSDAVSAFLRVWKPGSLRHNPSSTH